MNLQEQISRIKEVMGVISEQGKDPITVLSGLEKDIDSLLGYYVKGENGKFYDTKDASQSTPVEVGPTGAFVKAKIEIVMYGAKQQNKYTPQLDEIRERIKNGKFKEYFGEWDNIRVQPQKFDFYTGVKCTSPNKNPGCGPTV